MATRRNIQNQGLSSRDGASSFSTASTSPSTTVSDTSPAVPTHVIVKLLVFSLAMIGGPISLYFLTVDNVYSGNSTYAAITAAVAANVILIAYIVVAWAEDQGELADEKKRRQEKSQ